MRTKIDSISMLKAMRQKIVALIKIEAKMCMAERKSQQWQLLFQIGSVQYVIGKGGANTMFYTVGSDERKLCYPNDMLALIDTWITTHNSVVYAIQNLENKIVKRFDSQSEALAFRAKAGYHLIRIADGTKTKLFIRSEGLFNKTWKPLRK